MNPGVKREKGGKHQKRIIDLAHELYTHEIDLLNFDTARDILDREDDAEYMIKLLLTTDSLRKMFSEYQYSVALERTERIAKTLTNQMKAIRRAKSIGSRELHAEYKKEKVNELKTLPKAYLARKLVEYLPKKELDKIIRIGLKREERKRQKTMTEEIGQES